MVEHYYKELVFYLWNKKFFVQEINFMNIFS